MFVLKRKRNRPRHLEVRKIVSKLYYEYINYIPFLQVSCEAYQYNFSSKSVILR